MTKTITAALLLWAAAATAGDDIGEAAAVLTVKAATAAWVEAFNARDAQRIADLYAPDAVFWGTVSPSIRVNPDEVLEYFTASVAHYPKMRIGVEDQHVRVYGDTATNSGIYVTRNPQPGAEDQIAVSRFTFVYQHRGGQWIIVAHHSSRMPAT